MTLGHVYDLDLKRNETLIREVIVQAQGEVRLSTLSTFTRPYFALDGSRGVYQTSQGDLDQLYTRFGQLPD